MVEQVTWSHLKREQDYSYPPVGEMVPVHLLLVAIIQIWTSSEKYEIDWLMPCLGVYWIIENRVNVPG